MPIYLFFCILKYFHLKPVLPLTCIQKHELISLELGSKATSLLIFQLLMNLIKLR